MNGVFHSPTYTSVPNFTKTDPNSYHNYQVYLVVVYVQFKLEISSLNIIYLNVRMEKGLDTIYEKLIYNITSIETQALEKFTMFSRKKYGLTIDF